jgi:hypothetical protein
MPGCQAPGPIDKVISKMESLTWKIGPVQAVHQLAVTAFDIIMRNMIKLDDPNICASSRMFFYYGLMLL